ncbi:MAG: hypothetical protein ABI702_15030 [Burkholderiales bacterium]
MSASFITLLEIATTAAAVVSCAVQVFAAARSLDAGAPLPEAPVVISWPVDGTAG